MSENQFCALFQVEFWKVISIATVPNSNGFEELSYYILCVILKPVFENIATEATKFARNFQRENEVISHTSV